MLAISNEIKIVIGSWGSYNECNERAYGSKWLDLADNCLVYAITHEYTEFGECYSFLIITDYKCERKNICVTEGNKHYAFAYVWNKDVDYCSEFGTVGLQSLGGGITRVS